MTYSSTIFSKNYIVAIVNDDIISQYDIENRLDLVTKKLNISQTPKVRRHILPQVLQMLVDEHLQMQKALSLKLEIGNQEITRAITSIIDKQNSFQRRKYSNLLFKDIFFTSSLIRRNKDYINSVLRKEDNSQKFFKEEKYDINFLQNTSLIDEVLSEIAWHKVMQHTVHPQIGESEIDIALQALYNTENQTQNLLAEIVLPVDDSAEEENTRVLAEQLVGQIHTGLDFQAIARRFSHAASAIHGGDLGWILQGQLELIIEKVLRKMQPGQLSMPIRTLSGYKIILLREKKVHNSLFKKNITLHQLFMPLTGPKALSPQTQSELVKATQMVSSCEAFDALGRQTKTLLSGKVGKIKTADLLPILRDIVLQLAPYTASVPIPMNEGLVVLMICDSTSIEIEPQSSLPSRESIVQELEKAKIDTMRSQKLRDLRSSGFIEIYH